MSRVPYAAQTLVDEVVASDPKASGKFTGEDALGVYRTVKFTARASAWLKPALEFLADRRVVSLEMDDKNLCVTLSARSPLADSRDPWMVDLVRSMQSAERGSEDPPREGSASRSARGRRGRGSDEEPASG